MPTLVLWGKQDVALNWQMAQFSVDLCSSGKLVYLDEASHWVQRDCAEQVNQEILAFLQGR